MKRKAILSLISLFGLVSLFYSFSLIYILLKFSTLNARQKNIAVRKNLMIVSPKRASIGEKIDVELFYFPSLFSKYGLTRVGFKDSAGAYDIQTSIALYNPDDRYSRYRKVGFLPFYVKITYVIPSQVCPQEIVYTTCAETPTQKGIAKMRLIYEPIFSSFFDDEGYQGDGEFLSAPIEIK